MIKTTTLFSATLIFSNIAISQIVTTYNYTGAQQTYVVPPGVVSIDVDVMGAEGGDATGTTIGWGAGTATGEGGNGGRVTATLPVTPGETLYLYVGGEGTISSGGFNGGGNPSSCAGGTEVISSGGGGASDIRQGGTTLADRVIVAGGGCGSASSGSVSYSTTPGAGAGGGTTGANSTSSSGPCLPGQGGTQIAGGIGGNNSCWCSLPNVGGAGTLGIGGDSPCVASGLSTCSCSGTGCVSGGGGGGGYYGGGAGLAFAGGGGGSSYTDPGATVVTHTQGYQTGNGQIIITVICTPLVTSVSSTTVCFGELVTLSATSAGTGIVTWDNGVVDGVPFAPAAVGINTYTALSSDGTDCGFSVDIDVLEAPSFSLSTSDEFSGLDGGVYMTLTSGIFPFTYDWDNDGTGDFDDTQNLTNVGPGTYTVVVSQGNGCTATDNATVNSQLGVENAELEFSVYPNPTTDVFLISCSGEFNFEIFNSLGQLVSSGNGKDKREVSMSNLSDGIYFVKIISGSKSNSIQLIKE